MKPVLCAVILFAMALPGWAQNINSPSNTTFTNVTATQSVTVPEATAYVSGTVSNQTTFGVFPLADASLWNNSPNRIGATLSKGNDEGNGSSDEFVLDIESKVNASGITITQSQETSGSVATLSLVNAVTSQACGKIFCSGTSVTLQGLTTATWLNNQQVSLTSVTASSITFTDHTSHGTSGLHSDTGKATAAAFKGPYFSMTIDSEPSFGVSANAWSSYTHVDRGNTTAYAEGIVHVTDTLCVTSPCTINAGNGDGFLIGGELDVDNNGSDVNGAPDLGGCNLPTTKCKTNLYLGTGGLYPSSWAIWGSDGGPGFNNGINLQGGGPGAGGVLAGGEALTIPNSTYITSRTSSNSQDVILMHLDSLNRLELAAGYPVIVGTVILSPLQIQVGGSANHAICWKPDGKTLGYCSQVVASDGTCGTCN